MIAAPPVRVRISVALVTRNRIAYLKGFLASIRQQSVQPHEIIVSDDSDREAQAAVYAIAAQFDAIYIKGPQRGLYANRNNAALSCTGTHVLSADDDHTHPPGFMARISRLAQIDPQRVWVVSERNPLHPTQGHQCPAELRRDGSVGAPSDPTDCRAIADGATLYPAAIFSCGLRYDDKYPFGQLWYLWGVLLAARGWRITYDDQTYVWHDTNSSSDRAFDVGFLRSQLACASYVSLTHALWIEPGVTAVSRSLYHFFRRLVIADSFDGYECRARLRVADAIKVIGDVLCARRRYVGVGKKPAFPMTGKTDR
jgi:glycosyltransferase involved in cell wall biosynthesis